MKVKTKWKLAINGSRQWIRSKLGYLIVAKHSEDGEEFSHSCWKLADAKEFLWLYQSEYDVVIGKFGKLVIGRHS